MPTYRKKRVRVPKGIPLDKTIERFLLTGDADRDTPGWDLRVSRFFGTEQIERAWDQHKDLLLNKWKRKKRKGEPWVVVWLNWRKRQEVNNE